MPELAGPVEKVGINKAAAGPGIPLRVKGLNERAFSARGVPDGSLPAAFTFAVSAPRQMTVTAIKGTKRIPRFPAGDAVLLLISEVVQSRCISPSVDRILLALPETARDPDRRE